MTNNQIKNLFKLSLLLVFVVAILLASGYLGRGKAPETTPQSVSSTATDQAGVAPNFVVQYQGQDGKNALELLKASHKVSTKTFTGVGEYVESIDGISPDSSHFFSFYVNGQQAQVGADQYVTKATDQIEWRLEEIKP